jgi:hypothetical protein
VSRPPPPRSHRSQTRVLFELFLSRFFESESTVGRTDPRHAFFWLVGGLAAPGVFWAFWQNFRWHVIQMTLGHDGLRDAALFDKALYLTMTYVAAGLLASIAWASLVIDRRDALILGALPVRLRAIVAAKAGALFAYIGLVSAGMHAGAALLFGTLLGDGGVLTLRAMAAHVVAGSAMGIFVFAGLAAAASLGLAAFGPRVFSRLSGAMQVAGAAVVILGLVLLPAVSGAAVATLTGSGRDAAPWIVWTPPIWFLGLYEVVAGTREARLGVMADLAGTAGAALVSILAVFAITYPIACARVLASPSPAAAAAPGRATRPAGWLVRRLARRAETRGALQFTLATISRLQQHRLAVAVAAGIALTVISPILLAWTSGPAVGPRRDLTVPLLAVGPTLMFLVAAGVRVALSLPADPGARWIFATVPSPALAGRAAARRVMWTLAVVPGTLATAAIAAALWSPLDGALAGAAVALTGLALTDLHLWGFVGVPCARLLAPGSAQLQARWPWYLGGLYLVAVLLPQSLALARSGPGLAWLTAALLAAALLTRRGSDRAAQVNAISDEDETQLLLLDLSVPTPERRADA